LTSSRRPTYLIQDPYDDDAVQFIRSIFTSFGLRPVCFYTDPKARFYGERRYPELLGDRIEARYDIDPKDLASFAEFVKGRHDIQAVIPYREDTVETAAELVGLLGLPWNSRETVARFRDKYALKTYVQRRDPSLRVPACRLVLTDRDVWAQPVPDRYVIKPNDGFGNRNIGVFTAGAPGEREAVAAHLARVPGGTWVLEEYIRGPEFHMNGQIRSNGEVQLLGLLEYVRAEVNGHPTVYVAERQCRTDHPLFATIAGYTERLLRATGLRRSPFHLELKFDERGPCFIDLGARFPSESGGHMLSRLHPERPDVYTVAAHDYLSDNTFATDTVDWEEYDRHVVMLVYGISTQAGVIHRLDGIPEIEALPEFVNWPVKPRLGNRIEPTRQLGTEPYSVELTHTGGEAESDELIDTVHRTVRINGRSTPPDLIRAHALHLARRAGPKIRWWARNLGLWPS
jgi:hypothetical protein